MMAVRRRHSVPREMSADAGEAAPSGPSADELAPDGLRAQPLLDVVPRRRVEVAGTLALLGLLLLVLAAFELRDQALPAADAVALGLGLGLWFAAVVAGAPRGSSPFRPAVVPSRVRHSLLFAAVGLAAGAWLTSGDGVYTAMNLLYWLAALAAWCLAWWPGKSASTSALRLSERDFVTLLVLAGVVGVAAFFRFHALGDIPAEPTSDHAEKLLDVQDVLQGEHPIFFPRNTGREPAQFYVTAALIEWFGLPFSWETLKLGTALVGVLAVPAIFLFSREVGGRAVGLAAAALAAVSKWPIGDDRMGLRFPYAILASALALWLLFRYLRRGDRRDAITCGVIFGLGLHGYSPFRVVLLVVPVVFGLALVRSLLRRPAEPGGPGRPSWRRPLADGALTVATAFVACIPLAHYTVQHPQLVFERASSRIDAHLGLGDTLSTLARNTWNALLAFNWRGDTGWTLAVRLEPFLDPVTGAALLAGVALVCALVLARRSGTALALVLTAPILLLSSTLSLAFPHENPSVNRLGPAVPLVFTVAALPVGFLWGVFAAAVARAWPRGRRYAAPTLATVLSLGALAAAAERNYHSYFGVFADQYRAFAENTSEVTVAVRAQGASLGSTFLLGYPGWLDGRNVAVALGDLDWSVAHSVAPDGPVPAPPAGRRAVYVLHVDDAARRAELERRFPAGRYVLVRSSTPAKNFALYVVPAA